MKRCPECRRDYTDDTLLYCLDDGTPLLDGPATMDEPATAILSEGEAVATAFPLSELTTRPQVNTTDKTAILPVGIDQRQSMLYILTRKPVFFVGLFGVLVIGGFFIYRYSWSTGGMQVESTVADAPKPASKIYWQMTEAERLAFIQQRAQHIQTLIGDKPAEFDEESLGAIKIEIDRYLRRKDSLSQKPFEEGLRVIYGRASQYAPMIAKAYKDKKVPFSLGIYQAMIESEYRDCQIGDFGVGIFQFSRSTASKYGIVAKDYCDVQKQAVAAASYMSDLMSDFNGESSAGLGLLAYNGGEDLVRDSLRDLRAHGTAERSFWAIFSHEDQLHEPLSDNEKRYVPRFFAAAIIGETPEAFGLSTPALTTITGVEKE